MEYTKLNSEFFDKWNKDGWEWGKPITHEEFLKAKQGDWKVVLSPTKPVPKEWFGDFKNKKILGLASGGGQQMPIFTALGAECTVFDYSESQLLSEKMVAERENYKINIVKGDMSKPLPFEDESFDIIFNPVSTCYIEKIEPLFLECARVLKRGGIFMTGFDNGLNYLYGDDEKTIEFSLPWNPLKDKQLYDDSIKNNWGIQFSHSIEEQIGGQIKAGFTLTNIFEDTNGEGFLHEHGAPTFYVTRSVKL